MEPHDAMPSNVPRLRPRLIIVDDHQLILDSLAAALRCEFDIVGTERGGAALRALVERLKPDCLLLDLWLPETSGLELIPQVRLLQPAIKIVCTGPGFVDKVAA